MTTPIGKVMANLLWLQNNPEFAERPATIEEFIGAGYLNIHDKVRPKIRQVLTEIFGADISPESMTAGYQRAMITGGIGIGKGVLPDCDLPTPTGFKKAYEIKFGDRLIGSDGKPVEVTGVFPRQKQKVYEVKFTDGSSLIVDGDHLWTTYRRSTGGAWSKKEDFDTKTLAKMSLRKNGGYRIPIVKPVEFDYNGDRLIPGYTIGALIGDGCTTRRTVTLSGDDLEVGFRVQEELEHLEVELVRSSDDNDWRIVGEHRSSKKRSKLDFVGELERLHLMNRGAPYKHIPEEYMTGSIDDRIDILRGLMDTDGSIGDNNGSTFYTCNDMLSLQVMHLVQSLGGVANRIRFERKGANYSEYQVRINTPFNPFFISRKADKWRPRLNQPIRRGIVSVKECGESETICFKVAAEDQLFVAGCEFIVTHNTTFASIVLPYMAHWCLCLKDPQDFFNLLPGSRIAFMMMSTSESQAREVLFGDVVARISNSEWFQNSYPKDPNYKNQIRFPKDIWIIPGDSAETTFEGYNILGGILDEADSHKVTKVKDYASDGYDTINSRIESRFQDRGFLIVIGQMKKATGFAAQKYEEFQADKGAYTARMSIWESLGWHNYLDHKGNRMSFYYDIKRKRIVPVELVELVNSNDIMEIPLVYQPSFKNNPEKALRDLAGIPPKVGDPFISLVDKVEIARDKWSARVNALSPVDSSCVSPKLEKWFVCADPLRRAAHVDIAYAADGDAAAIAVGHVPEMVERDDELKPYIIFDCLIRVKAPAGGEIMISDLRRILYHLRDDLKFKITTVTLDGFQSQDTIQQLRKKRWKAEYLSVDRSKMPYEDLREALYEERVEFPHYMTQINPGDSKLVEIAMKELLELSDVGTKIDHPKDGSKDVADAMAGVCYTLMGDRQYRRKQLSINTGRTGSPNTQPLGHATGSDALRLLSGLGVPSGASVPMPPIGGSSAMPPGFGPSIM